MAVAWYFSMALLKQREATMVLFEERKLPPWVHNKALQKAVESRGFSKEDKDMFRKMKV